MADRLRLVRSVAVAAALTVGCTSLLELPVAPSDLLIGVVVYEHADFSGTSAFIDGDVPDLSKFRGPCAHDDGEGSTFYDWNDCMSSVRVAPGWTATLYRGANYKDDSVEVNGDARNLQDFRQHDCPKKGLNDCVSSIRVRAQ